MPGLPPELIHAVIAHCTHDQPTLLRLRAVNTSFKAAVTPSAFGTFYFSNRPQSGTRMLDLLQSGYEDLVHTVAYKDIDADRDRLELEQEDDLDITQDISSREAATNLLFAFRDLDRLSHLHTLSITFFPNYVGDGPTTSARHAIQESILDGLYLACTRSTPSALRPKSVVLENISTMHYTRSELGLFLSDATNLRLTVVSDTVTPRATSRSISLRFWGSFISRSLLARASALSSLTLHSDLTIGASLELDNVHLPSLRSLDLRRILFDCDVFATAPNAPPIGIDAFIMHHATTLCRLVLRGCKAKVELYGIEDMSGNESTQRQLLWADVWTRYEHALTNLTELEIFPERYEGTEEDPFDIWYLAISDGYWAIPAKQITGTRKDGPALKSLKAAIAKRRTTLALQL